MQRRKMTGKSAEIAEINRQSNPSPNNEVTKIPVVIITWKENPRMPRIGGVAISP